MGGKSSLVKEYSQSGLRKFEKNFTYVKSLNDERFGQIYLFSENSTKKFIALSDKICTNPEKVDTIKGLINFHANIQHDNLLRLIGYTRREEESLCSSKDVFTLFFEWFEHDLKQELEERVARKENMNEKEIWFMIKSIVEICSFLETKDVYHGDIRPVNIIMSEEGEIFLGDHAFIHPLRDNWGKVLAGERNVYLSPEQMRDLRSNKAPNYDVFKSDVFSLGMTVLYTMNLLNPIGAYDYTANTINYEAIKTSKLLAAKSHSPQLIMLLNIMLEFDEEKRPDFIELENTIHNIEQSQTKAISEDSNLIVDDKSSNFNGSQHRFNQSLLVPKKVGIFGDDEENSIVYPPSRAVTEGSEFDQPLTKYEHNPHFIGNSGNKNFSLGAIKMIGQNNYRRKY